ncbi:MAG: Gfo/Idh/MocA family oxidoreductase [Phycisphaerales bacterium]|nr:Gfo/Idh/MocA family oxidoreductase [Phycisphaerales bacterium]
MSVQSTHQTLRAAVVGGGAFGECHLKTFASMPQVQVAGLYTLEADRARELTQKYGGRPYSSLQELAADPSIDLVSIATPENAHFESFQILAQHEKAIYVEKPLATDLGEARRMMELSKSIIAMSGHCLRFESRLAHIFNQRPNLGRLHHMSFKNRRPRQHKVVYGRVHPAFVLLCHEIELANAFAGAPFKRVCAMESHFSAGQVDGISIMIEYPGNITCLIEGGFYLPNQQAVEENDQATLDFENGSYSLVMPHTGFTFVGPQGNRFINHHYENTVYGMEFGALRAALDYFTHCVRTQSRPTISTIEDGLNAVVVATAAVASAKAGVWVTKGEVSCKSS